MGQQQLLLLVFSIVIAGLAIVAGIMVYNEGRDKAMHNAIAADAMRIISDVKAWKMKPDVLGGGDGRDVPANDFSGVTLKALGYPNASAVPGAPYVTANGCYQLTALESGGAQVVAYDGTTLADCGTARVVATVTIVGVEVGDISWSFE